MHPDNRPIAGVTVNGREHKAFDAGKAGCRSHGAGRSAGHHRPVLRELLDWARNSSLRCCQIADSSETFSGCSRGEVLRLGPVAGQVMEFPVLVSPATSFQSPTRMARLPSCAHQRSA